MVEEDEEEPGLNLDNDSLIIAGDNGILITGWHGTPTTLTHDEQQQMRQVFGCRHKNMALTVEVKPTTAGTMKMMEGGRMLYECEDCGSAVIEGHVTTFKYRMMKVPDDLNNPFITGQH